MTGARRGGPVRGSSGPGGLRIPDGMPIAAILAAIGLLVVTSVTLSFMNGQLPFLGSGSPSGSGGPVARTPTPSDQVVVPEDPRADVPGTVVYVKDGNVWVQSGKTPRQLTTGGRDAMPSFSPDGAFVYFVRTRPERGLWVAAGSERYYAMDVPSLMRVPTAGGSPETLLDGKVESGRRSWFGWIRQPAVSPDGTRVAVLTDLPDPTRSNVVLQLFDLATTGLTRSNVPEIVPLGHQDPAWRPDGALLLYVRNARDGSDGTPAIWSYAPETGTARALTGPGYLHPAWSPDSQWIAATRTSAFGTDVVILRASDGAEVRRITTDGRSWAPTWSPRGDALAFLHAEGQIVDLRMVELAGTGPDWSPQEPLDLTQAAGLDSISRPGWFIPASLLPSPTPPPTPSPAPSSSAAASGAAPAQPSP